MPGASYTSRIQAPSELSGAPADYEVLTPERVALQYDVAGIGSRSAAYGIDVAVQFGLSIVLAILLFAGTILSDQIERRGNWLAVLLIVLWAIGLFMVWWGYFAVFEIAWSGQT